MQTCTMNDEAVLALQSDWELERFIGGQQAFILSRAGKYAGRYVTKSDDEWSIALGAFYEALRKFNPAAGAFAAFADRVIGHRLVDYFRGQRRFDPEMPCAPQVFSGALEPDEAGAAVQSEVVKKTISAESSSAAKDEIEAANALFAAYGFSFYDLAACSPKTEKTRAACARAAAELMRAPDLLREMKKTRRLPGKQIEARAKVPKKVLERHRNYLVAAALLLDGEYPVLSEYLEPIRKEVAACGASL